MKLNSWFNVCDIFPSCELRLNSSFGKREFTKPYGSMLHLDVYYQFTMYLMFSTINFPLF